MAKKTPATRQAGQTSAIPAKPAMAHDQPEGHDDREEGQLAADHRAELLDRETGHRGQGDDRGAEGPECDRGSVADEREAGGRERLESEADEHRRADRHRSPEAGGSFDEGAEGEADQQDLDSPVGREIGDGVLHHLELPGPDRDVVDEDGVEDDPPDGEEPEHCPVERGGHRHRPGHVVHRDGDQERRGESEQRRDMGLHVKEGQRPEEDDDRKRSDDCRDEEVPQRRVILSPRHLSDPAV